MYKKIDESIKHIRSLEEVNKPTTFNDIDKLDFVSFGLIKLIADHYKKNNILLFEIETSELKNKMGLEYSIDYVLDILYNFTFIDRKTQHRIIQGFIIEDKIVHILLSDFFVNILLDKWEWTESIYKN